MTAPTIEIAGTDLTVTGEEFVLRFTAATAPFPAELRFPDEAEPVCRADRPWLSAARGGGRIVPRVAGLPVVDRDGEAIVLRYDDVRWYDEAGSEIPGYRLALRYEIMPDGAAFVTTCFFAETFEDGGLHDFTLAPVFHRRRDENAHWAYWRLPAEPGATLIQALGNFERLIDQDAERHADGAILPFVAFDFGRDDRRDHHLEFFVEAWNGLTVDHRNTATRVSWAGRDATVAWTFYRDDKPTPGRAFQWRNTWGWCLRRWPVQRRPPFRVIHYLDNFERYPAPSLPAAAAAEGANLLILHESWRLDMKQGEFAADSARLHALAATCREQGLRLSLYVRGNEDGMRYDHGRHLLRWLTPDVDGIYIDFCSPIAFIDRDECTPGGRIGFRAFDRMMRGVRRTIGPGGVLIGHSGSWFSALGFTSMDAYLGGEQEKGRLLENPTVHAYLSGLSVSVGSLWTAAFPTYRSRRMLPFLAIAGQFPFVHVGVQLPSCSLAHPSFPAATTFARPLWRLWELFDRGQPIRCWSTLNTHGIFRGLTDGTGAAVQVDEQGNALLLLANYGDSPAAAAVEVEWAALGVTPGQTAVQLDANWDRNRHRQTPAPASFTANLAPHGLAAWLVTANPVAWNARLAAFARPYPVDPEAAAAREAELASLRRHRFEPPAWSACYLRVLIPDFPNCYEDSLWWDLFENRLELLDLRQPDRPVSLGWIGANGLQAEPPAREQFVWPGKPTPWIPLRVEGTPGEPAMLGIATRRGDSSFYSFVQGRLSPEPGETPDTYPIAYDNDIDSDWSLLTFAIRLPAQHP